MYESVLNLADNTLENNEAGRRSYPFLHHLSQRLRHENELERNLKSDNLSDLDEGGIGKKSELKKRRAEDQLDSNKRSMMLTVNAD